ncbi:MAG TPA: EAL domain-containing protein [Noviherbaspirillum sp.]|nr:EAL domain-containing protein [Noviherbaspirillum sp.]
MHISSSVLNARILVVDDSEANVKLLEYMLVGAGYTAVSSTMDSREVVDLSKTNRYDIILLDLNMPYLNGFQVMELLEHVETDGYLPVLVITAEPDHKVRALQAGAMDFISKPIDQTEVLTRLHNMLEIRLLHKNLRNHNQSLEIQVKEQTSELRAAEEKVGYLSNFDTSTGLPNRILLRERVERAQEKSLHEKKVMGLLIVDLAKLPLIRGSLGGEAEQNLLIEAACRLKKWVSPDDTVARFGDESFAIVSIKTQPKEIAAVANQIIALLDEPFIFAEQELHVEACVGIALFPTDGDGFDFLVQAASASARTALSSQTRRYCFYTPELNYSANERLKLENGLRRALERNEFLLHYQPQLDLCSGTVIGLEALIRWQHPELGLIPPARFIGLAEETGLIFPMGEWALLHACRQNKEWQNAGLPKIPVAVNLSAKQFAGNITHIVRAALAESQLEPAYLELELTESVSMEDPENTIGILQRLKAMGVRLSIDDFGTGYSNLNYLKRFPLDKLKLDQSFVRDLTSDPDDLSISRAVIAMAHSLRLKVIAEGVKTEGQLALLARNGCDEMQGYLFSKPLDAVACAELLRERKALSLEKIARHPHARTLLCIEEEGSDGSTIERTLNHADYTVRVAYSAGEAFEIMATEEIGVILCNQEMTCLRRTEFLSRVKHIHPAIVLILACCQTDLPPETASVNHKGLFKLLEAPLDKEKLLTTLNDAFLTFERNKEGERQARPELPKAFFEENRAHVHQS